MNHETTKIALLYSSKRFMIKSKGPALPCYVSPKDVTAQVPLLLPDGNTCSHFVSLNSEASFSIRKCSFQL